MARSFSPSVWLFRRAGFPSNGLRASIATRRLPTVVLLTLAAFLLTPLVHAFDLLDISSTAQGVRIESSANTNFYHVLVEGDAVSRIDVPVEVHRPLPDRDSFLRPFSPGNKATFYRVHRYHVLLPGDQDRDGMDDLFEVTYSPTLNPLDPSDAALDPDGDGIRNREEAVRKTNPTQANPGVVLESSPAEGEYGVAVTREAIFRLSKPLEAGVQVTAAKLSAKASGRTLLSRIQVSNDRKTITLFFPFENLPASEVIAIRLTGDGLKVQGGTDLDANDDGKPGGVRTLTFQTLGIAEDPATGIAGVVYDSEKRNGTNVPLAGVTITVDGAEETLRATTDSRGRFTLAPCPAGRFFVHVDGRTSVRSTYPDGDFYPYIGKAWTALAGTRNNLATPTGEIFLPLIRKGTLKAVSSLQPTTIGFPQEVLQGNPSLAGVSITVPPNSLFSDNGNPGGRVGIAPVPPDRLPEPLMGGQRFPLVITVQTDGASNFDQPVPVQFPNLPDPMSGKKLLPGEKSALWSFNHDTGRWEMQGTVTVSIDGQFLVSDPGVGIRQPGWHSTSPGSPPGPPPNPPPAPPEDETPCPGEDAYPQVWDLCVEITKCAVNLSRSAKELGGAVEIIEGAGTMVKAAVDMYTAGQQAKTNIVALAKPIIDSVRGQKEIAQGILDVANGGNPASVAIDAVNCILGLANSGAALACALDCRSTDPDCVAFASLMNTLSWISGVTELIVTGQGALDGLCLALDGISVLLGFPIPANATDAVPLESRPGRLAAPPPGYLALSEKLLKEAIAFQTEWSNRLVFVNLAEASIGPALDKLSQDVWRSGAFIGGLVDVTGSDGSVFRGRIGEDGVLPLPVAMNGVTYSVRIYEITQKLNAACQYVGPVPGTPFTVPTPIPGSVPDADNSKDSDKDDLPDYAESIAGTNPNKVDTDDDGINDITELTSGTDPLSAQNVSAGSLLRIASLDTPGDARGIATQGSLALVADGPAGLSVLSISNVTAPVLLGRLDTDGFAWSVAGEGTLCAIADDTNGIVIVDLSNPSTPVRRQVIATTDPVRVIAARDGYAYAGIGPNIGMIDLSKGALVQKIPVSAPVDGLAFSGNYLVCLTEGTLEVRDLTQPSVPLTGVLPLSFQTFPTFNSSPRRSLSVSGTLAYVGYQLGYFVADLSIPALPRVIGKPLVNQSTTHAIRAAADNTLLTLTSFGGNLTPAFTTYDSSRPTDTAAFLSTVPTGGEGRAITEYRGFALIASGTAGLGVFRFANPDDDNGLEVALTLNPPSTIESGRTLRLIPEFTATRRVSRVELVADGAVMATANCWPFELSWPVPFVTSSRTEQLRAVAYGFGTNSGSSVTKSMTILPPTTQPLIVGESPALGSTQSVVRRWTIHFAIELDATRVTASEISLKSPGPDGVSGTGDDFIAHPGAVRLLPGGRILELEALGFLPAGPLDLELSSRMLTSPGGPPPVNPLVRRIQIEQAAPTIRWIAQQDGAWENPANWNPNRVPGPDDIVLADLPGASVTISLGATANFVQIKSLICRENLDLSGGNLTITGLHQSLIEGAVTTSGDTKLQVTHGALVAMPGLTRGGGSFVAGDGGRFVIDPTEGEFDLSQWTQPVLTATVRLDARPGSRISAPRLQHPGAGPGNGAVLAILATGGIINLDSMGPTLEQFVDIRASESGVVFLPRLEILNGVQIRTSLVSLQAGGRLEAPELISVSQVRAFVVGAEAEWFAPKLAQIIDTELRVEGGLREYNFKSFVNATFIAKADAVVALPALLEVSGPGGITVESRSRANLPALQKLNGPFSGIFPASLSLRAASGSRLDVATLSVSPAGRIVISADGSNSWVNLPALTRLDGPASGSPGAVAASSGGIVDIPKLVSLAGTVTTFTSTGQVRLSPGGIEVGKDGEIVLDDSGQLLAGPVTLGEGGILRGVGTLHNSLVNGGFVQPDRPNAVGRIVIDGNYTQTSNGRIDVDLHGVNAGQFDVIEITGSASLSGTLAAFPGGGLNYAPGQRFAIMKFAGQTGNFTAFTGMTQGAVTLQPTLSSIGFELVAP